MGTKVMDRVKRFVVDDDGAAIVEYAFLVVLIALVAIVLVAALGSKVTEKFSELVSKL